MENIAQSTPSSFNESIYRQQTHQIGSPIQYLSLSLTPPPSPTPVDCHVASSTDSCAHHIPETATSVVCDLTSPPLSQLCADDCSVNGCDQNNESNVPSEVGNLDSLLQTLEEKFKEQRTSSIYSDTDQHPGIVTTSSRAKRYSVGVMCVHLYSALIRNCVLKQKQECDRYPLCEGQTQCWLLQDSFKLSGTGLLLAPNNYRPSCTKSSV